MHDEKKESILTICHVIDGLHVVGGYTLSSF